MKWHAYKSGDWLIRTLSRIDKTLVDYMVHLDVPDYPHGNSHWGTGMPESVEGIHGGDRANIFCVTVDHQRYCMKVFHDTRWHVCCRNYFGYSKGWRAFCNGLELESIGVSVPVSLAFAQKHPFGPSVVISDFISQGQTVRDQLKATCDPDSILLHCDQLTHQLADNGILHCDYRPRNILMRNEALVLTDLEDIRILKRNRDPQYLYEKMTRSFLCKLAQIDPICGERFKILTERQT